MQTYRASHPRGYGSVRPARRALSVFAASCGFCGTPLSDVESAAGEALANAVEHGDGEGSPGIDVIATFDGTRLVIEIHDHGVGFDCSAAMERSERQAPGTAARGLGIFLMRTLMDEVAYSERGSRVQLVKRLDEQTAGSAR
ncbi:MAG: ATP-binding protein [Candidatus Lustribacter sp.]|jgi:anti-sigma regulatory factor (Ser/Thr protein kinase)